MKVDFWTELATKKLDTYRLNDDAQVCRQLQLIRRLVYSSLHLTVLFVSLVDTSDWTP